MKRVLVAIIMLMSLCFNSAAQDLWNPSAPYETDIVIGSPAAPVTVVEYASLTCPHCARFHLEAYPEFKKNWLDTGKAKLVFRHLPLDQSALAAAEAVSCLPKDTRSRAIPEFFKTISEWAPKQNLAPVIAGLFDSTVNFETVISCMSASGYAEKIMQPGTVAVNHGVNQTPTFFVNGQKVEGYVSAADLGKLVDEKLAEHLKQ